MNKRTQNHNGFTLIELLITLAVIAICITLVLPAVQQSRMQARANQCQNNLKQLGLALHNYHDVFSTFAPGWVSNTPYAKSPSAHGWQVSILPFVGQAALFNKIEFDIPTGKEAFGGGKRGAAIEKTIIPTFRCPDDTTDPLNSMRGGWATSNYSGNFGSFPAPRLAPNGTAEFWPGNLITPIATNGIFWWNSNCRFRDITDGTSNTLLVGERGVTSAAGIWAGVRSNSIESDQLTDSSFGNEINSNPGAFSSLHPKGAFFLFCDGSVRFISEEIDSRNRSPEHKAGGTFQLLSSKNDGMPVSAF
ncbi:MAG: DUF1559 domain-containing protein [Planctomycetaceae bacterium]|nr:DUF1559 domain-containing protein [Planctomycetaceae bacterium]